MSKVCGIDLDGKDARIVGIEGEVDDFAIIKTQFRKISIADYKSQSDVNSFRDTILAFFNDIGFDRVVIKERMATGMRPGGTITFKMEGLIQTAEQEVIIIHPNTIKSKIKGKTFNYSDLGLYNYQIEAFEAAFACL